MMTSMGRSKVLFTGEGIKSSIAITEWDDGAVQFHVSGKVEASTESYDMRLQRGGDGGIVRQLSLDQTHRDLRDGTPDSADCDQVLRQAELLCGQRSAHT